MVVKIADGGHAIYGHNVPGMWIDLGKRGRIFNINSFRMFSFLEFGQQDTLLVFLHRVIKRNRYVTILFAAGCEQGVGGELLSTGASLPAVEIDDVSRWSSAPLCPSSPHPHLLCPRCSSSRVALHTRITEPPPSLLQRSSGNGGGGQFRGRL